MFSKLFLFAIAFAVILNYIIIPALTVIARLIGSLGAQGALKHFLILISFASLVLTLGVFIWLLAKFLRIR